MDDLTTLKMRLEYIFLKEIVKGLRQKNITAADTKIWAQTFLAIEPFTSQDDANTKIDKFCQTYPQFSRLKEYLDSYMKEEHVDVTIDKMRERIKANDLDGALQIAKGDS
jgi:hypothetical protein